MRHTHLSRRKYLNPPPLERFDFRNSRMGHHSRDLALSPPGAPSRSNRDPTSPLPLRYGMATASEFLQSLHCFARGTLALRPLRPPLRHPVKLDPHLLALVTGADCVISSCLLSQLTLHAPCFKGDSQHIQSIHAVYSAHIDLLRKARKAILITDTAFRHDPDPDWHSLLNDFPLPAPSATWTWLLAPPGEKHSDSGESRRVEAFTFSSDR